MDGSTAALSVAAGGLTVAACALARTGWRHQSFRGWHFWVLALLVGAAGIAFTPVHLGAPSTAATTQALLLAWPVLTLVGLRRFHARLGLPGRERADWGMLAACTGALLLAASLPDLHVAAVLLPGTAALLLHLYAAAVMSSSRTVEDIAALRLLAAVIAVSALVPAMGWAVGAPASVVPYLMARAMAAAFGLAVMAFTTLALMSERTEHELRESRQRLRVLANTDALTCVPNRRHFQELANRVLRADAEPPVLLLFDIDHFKLINDKFGHATGDRALRLVGRCMQDALRAHDIAGRLGGDEFALLLGGTSMQQALGVADRIVLQLQRQSAENRLPCLGLSFGVVLAQPGEDVDDTLRRADQALYEAKRQGRSRAVMAVGREEEPVFSESQRLGLTAM